jgi:hypothetical protein
MHTSDILKILSDMKLFHITKKKNLQSILDIGLLPEYTQGLRRSWSTKRLPKRVWLTDSIAIPIKQAGDTFVESEWCVLEIDAKYLNIMPHRTTCYEEGKNIDIPNEFVTFDAVPKENIKVLALSTINL